MVCSGIVLFIVTEKMSVLAVLPVTGSVYGLLSICILLFSWTYLQKNLLLVICWAIFSYFSY